MTKDPRRKRMSLLAVHRTVGLIAGLLLLYFGASGTIVQLVDLAALLRHAPASDPDVRAMRESLDGPGNYAVIAASDDDAPPLPSSLDLAAALDRGFASVRSAPVSWIEVRMIGDRPFVRAMAAGQVVQVDPASGAPRILPPMPEHQPASLHLAAKRWHRLWVLGDGMLWLNALAGIALGVLVLAGLVLWFRLWRARRRIGRHAPFWRAGGPLRELHRSLAVLAAAPLLVVAVSGTVLSFDSLMLAVYRLEHPDRLRFGVVPAGMVDDYASPLTLTEVARMARAGRTAYRDDQGARPIKAFRLRVFAGMPQVVVIAGGASTTQQVYDTDDRRPVGLSEPGYPDTVFPTGWEWHERWKRIHRGDILGLPGRLLSLFAGLSLAFFATSGLWMYATLWRRRRRAGRAALFWH